MTWTKVTWWSHDQHHKQDPRSTKEDPRYQAKSKHEDGNQARCKIVKKRARQRWPDVALWGPDASDQLLGNSRRQQQWPNAEQGSDWTHGLHYLSSQQQLSEDRTQRGSRAAQMRSDMSDRWWPNSAVRPISMRALNGWDDRTRPVRTTAVSGQYQKAGFRPEWLLSPWGL